MAASNLGPQYRWTATTPDGKRKKGRSRASSPEDLASDLAARGLVPIEITEAGKDFVSELTSGSSLKLKKGAAATFARQLELLLRSGITPPRALESIGSDADERMSVMCRDLAEKVTAGMPLSEALAGYPRAFDDVFCSYIAAGEEAGTLAESVARLAHMLEQDQSVRTKVKAVTAYPKMVSGAIVGIFVLLLVFLVPRFAAVYESFGAELPAPTRALIAFSESMVPFKLKFQLGVPPIWKTDAPIWQSPINFTSPTMWVGLFAVSYIVWRRRNRGNLLIGQSIEKIKFRLPLLGKLTKHTVLYRWSSTLAGALDAGLQLPRAMELAGRASGSDWIRLVMEQAVVAVQSGRPLSSELLKHPELFNAQMRTLIVTGEETGEPAEMFNHLAANLESEISAIIATLGAKIEVALLLVMGVVVGTMVTILYLPMMNLSQVASEGYQAGNQAVPPP